MDGKPRLLDQVHEQLRMRHYSTHKERVYYGRAERSFLQFSYCGGGC